MDSSAAAHEVCVVTGPFPVFATHAYGVYGFYTVTRTVQFTTGTLAFNLTVQINPNPVAFFSSNSPVCSGQPVSFTDLSFIPSGFSGYIVKWIWDFGDGTPPLVIVLPSNPNVAHTYMGAALSHYVTLTVVTSSGCSNSVTSMISLKPAPVANFTWFTGSGPGAPVQFIDLSYSNGGPIIAWNWSFGDPASGVNNLSTQNNPGVSSIWSPGKRSPCLMAYPSLQGVTSGDGSR